MFRDESGLWRYTWVERGVYNFLVVWVAQWIAILEATIGLLSGGWVVPFWSTSYMFVMGQWLHNRMRG